MNVESAAEMARNEAIDDSRALRAAVEMSGNPTFFLAASTLEILDVNRAGSDRLGCEANALLGRSFMEFVAEKDKLILQDAVPPIPGGEERLHVATLDLMTTRGARGRLRLHLHEFGDLVVAVEQTVPQIDDAVAGRRPTLADLDPLTGLMNRFELERRIAEVSQSEAAGLWGLLFIDLNEFKLVNDRLGHLVGDRVLAEFAHQLTASARPSDLIVRYGGDEFVVLVEGIRSQQALNHLASRLAREVRVEVEDSDPPLVVTASVGAALSTDGRRTPEQLIAAADQAMYQSKRLIKPR